MSQPNRPQGAPPIGSTRRTRELVEAGFQVDRSPPRQRVLDAERNAEKASPPRQRQPMPAALSASRNGGQGIGMAISRPTQVPQWPLAVPVQGSLGQTNNFQFQAGRGQVPQRPPRPSKSKIPSMLDASKLQEHTPTFQYIPQPQATQSKASGESPTSPNSKLSVTPASRLSTDSSTGSIPEFPMPIPGLVSQLGPAGPARRSPNIGPPPTARRGPSSHYSTTSYVSPIQEESPRTPPTHESYASSTAMPSAWTNETFEYLDDYESGERVIFAGETIPEEEGRDSRQSNGDDNSESGLVRSASIGRRGKPSMVETKGAERGMASPASLTPANPKLAKMGVLEPLDMRAAHMRAAAALSGRPSPLPVQVGNADSPLAGGTGLIENSSSESSSTVTRVRSPKDGDDVRPPLPSGTDPRISQIIHAHQAASGVVAADEKELERSFSRLSAMRRPPRLDLSATRDQEARGSLTSLPDLIRRATRLAAMIDKGKRPGSRLNNLNDFSDTDLAREKEEGALAALRPQSGLSGMLAAFPPPGLATPRENSPRPMRSWPTPDASTNALNPTSPSGEKPARRCCGLPLWLFLLITLVTLLIVAAAVLVPLFLLVINKSSNPSNSQSELAQCQQNLPCANGGTSIIASDACSCICANGFTGSTCTTASSGGCTTTNISGSNGTVYTNVTLGEAIPRLIATAQANFSIPLSSDIILARFNSASLSCNSENALVTFNGVEMRLGSGVLPVSSSGTTPTSIAKAKFKRDFTFTSTSYETSTSVSPSIIIDTSSPPFVASTTTRSGTTTSTGIYPSSTASFIITQQTLDFARVVTLYVLQKKNMDNAVTAQTNMQTFLTRPSNAGNVTLGNGNSVDFLGWAVDVGQGRVGRVTAAAGRRWIGWDGALPAPANLGEELER